MQTLEEQFNTRVSAFLGRLRHRSSAHPKRVSSHIDPNVTCALWTGPGRFKEPTPMHGSAQYETEQRRHSGQVEALQERIEVLERHVARLNGQFTSLARDYRTLAATLRERGSCSPSSIEERGDGTHET